LAPNTKQFSNNNTADVISGGVHYSVSTVGTALSTVNSLNSTLGQLSGTPLNINLSGTTTLTINASTGTLHTVNGVNYRVFTVTGFNTTNGNTIKIVGDTTGSVVLFNFTNSANFNNQVALVGLAPDQVLWNFVGGSNLTGGPTLQINDNASSSTSNIVQGVFLDPNGAISVTNADILGGVFGGDTHDFQYVSGSVIDAPTQIESVPGPVAGAGLPGVVFAGFGLLFWRRHRRRPGAASAIPVWQRFVASSSLTAAGARVCASSSSCRR
jgi:hypothetical protein